MSRCSSTISSSLRRVHVLYGTDLDLARAMALPVPWHAYSVPASPAPVIALPLPEPCISSTTPARLLPPAQALVFVPQVEPLVNALEGAIAESAAKREADAEAVRLLAEGKGGKGEHTVPEPFELSQPRFRTVPVPEEAVDVGFTGENAMGWQRPGDCSPRRRLVRCSSRTRRERLTYPPPPLPPPQNSRARPRLDLPGLH